MTISAPTTKTNPVAGDDVTTVYPYNFLIPALDAERVIVKDLTTLIETIKERGIGADQYGISGIGNPSGGNVTFVTALTSNEEVVIKRFLDLNQLSDYEDDDAIPADTIENDFDLGVMVDQQLQEQIDRGLKTPETSTKTIKIADDATNGQFLTYSGSGDTWTVISSDAGSTSLIPLPVSINNGGTEANSAATARINLGLEINNDVQAFDADILKADTNDNLVAGFTMTPAVLTLVSDAVAPNLTSRNIFTVAPATNWTLTNPSNSDIAGSWFIYATNSGVATLTLDTDYKETGSSAGYNSASGKVNIINIISDGSGTYDVTITERGV